MRHTAVLITVLIAALLNGGCTGMPSVPPTTAPIGGAPTPLPTVPAAPLPTGINPSDIQPAASGGDPRQIELAAAALLAAELGVGPGAVTVLDWLAVQWPDAGLGCPQEGAAYAQVITPGYLVTLAVEGRVYRAHLDAAGGGVICHKETQGPVMADPGTDPVAAEFVEQARFDLAERMGISLEQVVLISVEAVDWPDSSLGCPEEGEEYIQALTSGYRVVLGVGDQRYEYHTALERMVFCETPGL
ncbi:MAG: hypothetical protein Kow00124_18530 [Anaerolineae bacterium]